MKKSGLILALSLAMAVAALPGAGFTAMTTYASEARAAVNVVTTGGVASLGSGSASIKITQNSGQTLIGKKFEVFKLFDAENSTGLESINYTFNDTYKKALQNIVGPNIGKSSDQVTEYEVIDYIQALNNNEIEGAQANQTLEGRYSSFRYFVESLRTEMKNLGYAGDIVNVANTQDDGSVSISGLDYGYYIIDEISDNAGTHSASSLCMVSTANPTASVKIKSDYPSVTKKILEDDGEIGWNDIADYEIGQTVPYKFTSNVPDMNGYSTYFYAWHDVMDEALTFDPNSVSITITDTAGSYTLKSNEFTVSENVLVDGVTETFVIKINDLKLLVDREFNRKDSLGHNTYGQTVTLNYNATLNDKAALDTGRPGFENDVRLEFSNDPDAAGAGKTGYTPWDTVVCFTFKLDILKTNDHDQPLKDAKFKLYSDANCTNEVYVKKTANGYNVINRDSIGGDDHTGGTKPAEAVEMVSDANGKIVIYGLDGGTYYIKETDAPAGYRQILDPIKIEVVPVYTLSRDTYIKGDGAGTETLKSLGYNAKIVQFLDGIYTTESPALNTNVTDGSGNLTVVNAVGTKLPVTGSNMTIILIMGGCTIMLATLLFGYKKKEEC